MAMQNAARGRQEGAAMAVGNCVESYWEPAVVCEMCGRPSCACQIAGLPCGSKGKRLYMYLLFVILYPLGE
jgi:hypothetical protein